MVLLTRLVIASLAQMVRFIRAVSGLMLVGAQLTTLLFGTDQMLGMFLVIALIMTALTTIVPMIIPVALALHGKQA